MERQVLEGLDLRRLPALGLRPVDGQHVVGELFTKQQGGGVRLGLGHGAVLDGQVCGLE